MWGVYEEHHIANTKSPLIDNEIATIRLQYVAIISTVPSAVLLLVQRYDNDNDKFVTNYSI